MALSDDEFKSKMDYYDKLIERATAFNDKVTADDQSRARAQEKQAKKDIAAWKEKLEAGGANIEQYKELIRLAEDLIATNRSQREVFGRIKNEIKVTVNKFNDFVRSTAVQYNYAQQMAKQYKLINRELGANAHQSDLIQKNFKLASPEVILMGGSLEDMTEMMQSFGEETGRARALTQGELEDITAIAKGVNLTTSEATKMAETFDLMGMSTDSMASHLANVYKESQTLGLNAQKVVKVLNANIKTMQSYSFANGVKGMTEMAKQAVKMRLDVSDVLQMSEKFYQPEAAIEAAANLQMLGGDIAKAFGDPFETMYLARNKPEELAKKVGEMTENMMQFNEETGEYEMPAEVRMQLKATG
jgi:methyl-accepting chemotaxis protein